jgi:toxin-antitoxin system PIN domain toxin
VFLLDVNVVVAAFRGDHPLHAVARSWFDDVVTGGEPFAVPPAVWASFLRLVTSRRVFPLPTTRAEAFAFLDAVVGQPNHLLIGPGPRHLIVLRQACDEADASGDLVPDAVLVALAMEHSATIATFDRDFARFGGVGHLLLRG